MAAVSLLLDSGERLLMFVHTARQSIVLTSKLFLVDLNKKEVLSESIYSVTSGLELCDVVGITRKKSECYTAPC